MSKEITITNVKANFEREELIRPFGFKGAYLTEVWQSVAYMAGSNGKFGLGLCTQSPLWSDAQVFASHSESGGNAIMFAIQEYALNRVRGAKFSSPIELLEQILPDVYGYAKKICEKPDLRLTFALNSLVGFDNAAWMLYAQENEISSFDEMIGSEYRGVLSERQKALASIPLIAYGIPIDDVRDLVNRGYYFLKIKIGSDPDKDGSYDKMLEWDKKRIEEIHNAVSTYETEFTDSGKIAYYLDANGRYDSKDRLKRLLDHARAIGAYDQIIVVEEPFAEEAEIEVGDLGVTIAADESAHSEKEAKERIEMGYGAIALKPIAKTLSMSLKIAKLAKQANIPCFCADLTVIPVLVEWNKNVASRLSTLPGLKTGVVETNGDQNYKRWETLLSYHPNAEAPWAKPQSGKFILDDDFYNKSGGILMPPKHYLSLVSQQS